MLVDERRLLQSADVLDDRLTPAIKALNCRARRELRRVRRENHIRDFPGDLCDTPASSAVKIFSLFVIVRAFKARSDPSLEGEY